MLLVFLEYRACKFCSQHMTVSNTFLMWEWAVGFSMKIILAVISLFCKRCSVTCCWCHYIDTNVSKKSMHSFENLKPNLIDWSFLVYKLLVHKCFDHKLFKFTFRVNLYQKNNVYVTQGHHVLFYYSLYVFFLILTWIYLHAKGCWWFT